MLTWLIAYLVTCAVEVPLVVWLTRRLGWWGGPGRGLGQAVAVAWALQVTHPVLWLVDPRPWGWLLLAEAVIVAVEGVALACWAARSRGLSMSPIGPAFLTTLVANASSLVVGLLPYLVG